EAEEQVGHGVLSRARRNDGQGAGPADGHGAGVAAAHPHGVILRPEETAGDVEGPGSGGTGGIVRVVADDHARPGSERSPCDIGGAVRVVADHNARGQAGAKTAAAQVKVSGAADVERCRAGKAGARADGRKVMADTNASEVVAVARLGER